MHRENEGWKLTAHVRLMHAHVRRAISQNPKWHWDNWSMPISDTDGAHSISYAFSGVYIDALIKSGLRFPHHILHRDAAQAREITDVFLSMNPGPDEPVRRLVHSLIELATPEDGMETFDVFPKIVTAVLPPLRLRKLCTGCCGSGWATIWPTNSRAPNARWWFAGDGLKAGVTGCEIARRFLRVDDEKMCMGAIELLDRVTGVRPGTDRAGPRGRGRDRHRQLEVPACDIRHDRLMRTPLADQLGVEFSILAFSHCRDVVARFTRAGGMGGLGAVAFTPDELQTELDWIDSQVGDLPYGVDTLIPRRYAGSDEGGHDATKIAALIPEEHRAFVDALLDRHGVPPLATERQNRGLDVSVKAGGHLLDVAFSHPNVRLIANALGPAPVSLVEAAHERGVLVAGLTGTVSHALAQVEAGVDVVVAQGCEAGGHTGQISTMVLVPQVVDAVAPVPVLAAGGIANGRQVAAALALGAQGVWCGSVWLTTEEAETHIAVKEKFLAASSSDTVRSRCTTGKPARQLRSAWTDAWDDPATPAPLPMPLQTTLIGDAMTRMAKSATSNPGAKDLITYFVGQVVGQLDKVKPARQVVLEMVEEFIETMVRMNASLPD